MFHKQSKLVSHLAADRIGRPESKLNQFRYGYPSIQPLLLEI
jgi:hypothetical protein